MSSYGLIFILMVFAAVFLLALGVIVPTMGTGASTAKRLRGRIRSLHAEAGGQPTLLRQRYLRELSPWERGLEELPWMQRLGETMDQAGLRTPAYRLLLTAAALGIAVALAVGIMLMHPLYALLSGAMAAALPFVWVHTLRRKRLAQFEEQLPEALDMLARALRAGHPFTDALKLIGEETAEPMAGELKTTFADLNYGISVRDGLVNLLTRVPSISLAAVVTAVLVQRESGGNLAEVIDKISAVVRGRFRLQRRVRTLSAEGRMSAWVLTLVPFALAGVISVTTPTYLPSLLDEPLGRKLVMVASVAMVIGIVWINRVIRIRA